MGQTPGKMAMEIEIINDQKTPPNLFFSFLRYIPGFTIGFLYVFGIIIFNTRLSSAIGTEHISSLWNFFAEYHKFGIGANSALEFLYYMLIIFILTESLFVLFTEDRKALDDFWAKTRVILNLQGNYA